jgi:hypothetical protein
VKATCEPSGDQAGDVSQLLELLRSACPLPSGFITKIWAFDHGPRVAVNAIFAASGDQAGSPSRLAAFVRSVWPEPSLFMT